MPLAGSSIVMPIAVAALLLVSVLYTMARTMLHEMQRIDLAREAQRLRAEHARRVAEMKAARGGAVMPLNQAA